MLLGFDNAAHMSMETKMAGNVESVKAMIASLLLKAKPVQEKELSSLLEFAKERGHSPSAPLELWDIPYWRRKYIRSSLKGLEEVAGTHSEIPEYPSDQPDTNPLLKGGGLPDLSTLTTDQCIGALRKLTLDYEAGLWKIEEQIQDGNVNFEGNVLPELEKLGSALDGAWGLAKVLYLCGGNPTISPTTYEPLHHAARAAKAKRFYSPHVYSVALKAWKELEAQKSQSQNGEEIRRVVGKYVLEGHLNGLKLDGEAEVQQFMKIRSKLAEETARFNGKLSVATQVFSHTISDPKVVRDFPLDLLEDMSVQRSQPRRGPWKVTLVDGIAPRFMEHCPDPHLRWNIWQASVRIASAFGPTKEGSFSVIDKLKGKKNFTEEDLNNSSHEDSLRAYFPLEKVLNGLFKLCGHLFSLEVECLPLPLKGASAWHPDVRLYALNDLSSGETLGAFYLDPWARPGAKLRSSEVPGWMFGLRSRLPQNIPLAALVFNFPTPFEKRPCLLSLREVKSLFQQFGQVLQHLLCTAQCSEVFGLNNVEWDAVDICSNFMALWLTKVPVLKEISGHYETGEQINDEIANVLATEGQQLAGFDLCRELYLSDLDLELHSSTEYWMDIVRRLWPEYHTVPLDKKDCHVCSFKAVFESGSNGASYFSKPWSLMVASDIFGAFSEELSSGSKEQTKLETEEKVGSRFRSTFLASGGACHPGEVFRRFRGRDPSPKALLKVLELETQKQL
ncbi:hypothetical protein J437_LFUL004347 [Ladona fulva]|uniref:Peptidase M3A/M3B catalytic domain-containing protein n=1 Tax=Ladona fulva TaxID=123851 RepID=A0A8K0K5S0_LADFU|nr:hypothetical protein J437_LFUL004347 [Ladona fulva]